MFLHTEKSLEKALSAGEGNPEKRNHSSKHWHKNRHVCTKYASCMNITYKATVGKSKRVQRERKVEEEAEKKEKCLSFSK